MLAHTCAPGSTRQHMPPRTHGSIELRTWVSQSDSKYSRIFVHLGPSESTYLRAHLACHLHPSPPTLAANQRACGRVGGYRLLCLRVPAGAGAGAAAAH
eukprot:1159538-Pelagomonas_calceolata.AAC.4